MNLNLRTPWHCAATTRLARATILSSVLTVVLSSPLQATEPDDESLKKVTDSVSDSIDELKKEVSDVLFKRARENVDSVWKWIKKLDRHTPGHLKRTLLEAIHRKYREMAFGRSSEALRSAPQTGVGGDATPEREANAFRVKPDSRAELLRKLDELSALLQQPSPSPGPDHPSDELLEMLRNAVQELDGQEEPFDDQVGDDPAADPDSDTPEPIQRIEFNDDAPEYGGLTDPVDSRVNRAPQARIPAPTRAPGKPSQRAPAFYYPAPQLALPRISPAPTSSPRPSAPSPPASPLPSGDFRSNPSSYQGSDDPDADIQRIFFDDDAPQRAPIRPKGVLMRMGIDPRTLHRGELPADLLNRIRKQS